MDRREFLKALGGATLIPLLPYTAFANTPNDLKEWFEQNFKCNSGTPGQYLETETGEKYLYQTFAAGILNTVINSAITKSVYPEEVGGALGVSASMESLTRVVGPSAGGLLLEFLGPWAPGVIGAAIMAWLVSYVWRRIIINPDPPLPGRAVETATQGPVQAHL